jgi:hypothetical protein
MPCYCAKNDAKCLEYQNLVLPNNPCVEDAMIDYAQSSKLKPITEAERRPQTTAESFSSTEKPSTTEVAKTDISLRQPPIVTNKWKSLENVSNALTSTETSDTSLLLNSNASAENATDSFWVENGTDWVGTIGTSSIASAVTRKQLDKAFLSGAYATQTPPPKEGGCLARNIRGDWIRHYKGAILRMFHDWSQKCSSWCECTYKEKLNCHNMPCLTEGNCETPSTSLAFGERLYVEGRGACFCQTGKFICDTNDESGLTTLEPGLYITLGYSHEELKLIKDNVPKAFLEKSGMVSPESSVANDIVSRLQFALERVMPKGKLCRIVLLENFVQDSVMLLQLQWYGINKYANETEPHWQVGQMEKVCSPYVRVMEQNFLLEKADRYQLLLSAIKQIRVVDLLNGLPSSAAHHNNSSASYTFCFVTATLVVMRVLRI